MTQVYVSNADSGDISVLQMDVEGYLQWHSTCHVGGQLMPMALSPCRRFLYVVRRSEPMVVVTLAIDSQTRGLSWQSQAALPASMAYVSTDRSGRFLLAASYQGDQVTVSPVLADGTVGPVQQVVSTEPHAHAIVPSPCNRFVLATVLGADQLWVFSFCAVTGHLGLLNVVNGRAGSGPRHLCWDASGRWVYVLNELDGTLDVLAWDATVGALSRAQTVGILPSGFAGKPWAADLHLSPNGRHLYASDRTSSTLAHLGVDAETGWLTVLGHTVVETQPRGFAVDPTGRFVLVVGQASHHLGLYAIDPNSGALTAQQRIAVGQGPNWVEMV